MKYITTIVFLTSVLLALLLTTACDEVTAPIDVDAPINLSIEIIAENRINLSWEYQNSTSGIKYVIARKSGEEQWVDEYGESTSNNFVDSIPTNSYTVYSYRVKAVSEEDGDASFFSDAVGFFSPLTKPTDLHIRQISQDELELTWKDNAIGETGYRIDRKVGAGNWVLSYQSLGANTTILRDSFSEMFTEISYRVYAYVGPSSGPQNELSFMSAYPSPHNPEAYQLSSTEIVFSWDYSSSDAEIISGFEVYRKTGTSDWQHLINIVKTHLEIIDVPVYESGTIAYRVRAYQEENYSPFSEPVEIDFNISILGSLSLNNPGNSFLIENHQVFIANDYNGVLIADTENHSAPRTIATISLPGRIISLFKKDNLLLAGNHSGKVFIIDVTEVNSPTIINTLQTLNPVYDLLMKEIDDVFYIFIANGNGGILTASYDENNPTDPKIIYRHSTHGVSTALLNEDNFIYLADGHNGILKLDISNPSALSIISHNKDLGNCIAVSRLAHRLYVSTGSMGLRIVDKNSLQPIIHYDTEGFAVDVHPTNRYAYIADRYEGLYIVNIVNDLNPFTQAVIKSQATVNGIITQGSFAYLLTEDSLQIIQVLP